jgi:hypothetical protein
VLVDHAYKYALYEKVFMISNYNVPYEVRKKLHEDHLGSLGVHIEDFLTFPDQHINPEGLETEFRKFKFADDRHLKMNRIHPVYNGMHNVVPLVEKQIESDENANLEAGHIEQINIERQLEKENKLAHFQQQVKKRVKDLQKSGKHEKERRMIIREIEAQQIRDKRLRMESYGDRVSKLNKEKMLKKLQTEEAIKQKELQEQQQIRLRHGISPLHLPLSPAGSNLPPKQSPMASVTSRMSMPPSARSLKTTSRVSTPVERGNTDRYSVRTPPRRDSIPAPDYQYSDDASGSSIEPGEQDKIVFDLEEQSKLLLQSSNAARASLMSHHTGKKIDPVVNSRLFQREIDVQDHVVLIQAPRFTISDVETQRETNPKNIQLSYDPKLLWNQQAQDLQLNKEQQLEKEKEHMKYMEEKRYLEALRDQFINRVREKNIPIPPLCTCYGIQAFDECNKHAQNCQYYKNPKAYARALSSLLTSMNQHK